MRKSKLWEYLSKMDCIWIFNQAKEFHVTLEYPARVFFWSTLAKDGTRTIEIDVYNDEYTVSLIGCLESPCSLNFKISDSEKCRLAFMTDEQIHKFLVEKIKTVRSFGVDDATRKE